MNRAHRDAVQPTTRMPALSQEGLRQLSKLLDLADLAEDARPTVRCEKLARLPVCDTRGGRSNVIRRAANVAAEAAPRRSPPHVYQPIVGPPTGRVRGRGLAARILVALLGLSACVGSTPRPSQAEAADAGAGGGGAGDEDPLADGG